MKPNKKLPSQALLSSDDMKQASFHRNNGIGPTRRTVPCLTHTALKAQYGFNVDVLIYLYVRKCQGC